MKLQVHANFSNHEFLQKSVVITFAQVSATTVLCFSIRSELTQVPWLNQRVRSLT